MDDSVSIRRTFHARFEQEHNVAPANKSEEIAEFKDDVLSGSRTIVTVVFEPPDIVAGGDHDRERGGTRSSLKLLDNRVSAAYLLVEDDGPTVSQILHKACDRLFVALVAAMDYEYLRSCRGAEWVEVSIASSLISTFLIAAFRRAIP